MPTKIRRSLFIGLGGTGMRTLLNLKKLFIETYGEVPKMIGFLGIDTDNGEFSESLDLKDTGSMGFINESELYVEGKNRENKVNLDRSEQVRITIESPQALYSRNKNNYSWLCPENSRALLTLTHGAGQIRTNGRFALIAHTSDVEERINQSLNKVGSAKAIDNNKYELIDNKTDVYLIYSVAGGTGSGIFIDVAYTIRRLAGNNCKLTGFGVLPEVFRAQLNNGVERVRSNGYGAIMDLDWLMGHDLNENPITLPLANGRSWNTQYPPFDACILVDNKNGNLDVYEETKQIEEMLALTLITSVGELSKANVSVVDNLAISTFSGDFDVRGKRAWAIGMGVCEVIIRSEELRKIYSHTAAIHLINILLNKPADINPEVIQWIDQVRIREHDADDVINYLLDANVLPLSGIDKRDYSDAFNVVASYVAAKQPKEEDVEERLQVLITNVSDALRSLIIRSLNRSEGMGVGATEDLLSGIESEIRVYLKEMNEELGQLTNLETQYTDAVRSACNKLREKASGLIKLGVDEAKEEVCDLSTHLAKTRREKIRRVKAISFYNDLLAKIGSYQNRVKEIRQRLEIVTNNSRTEIAKLRKVIAMNTETFQINLTTDIESTIYLDSQSILISDFITALREGNKIFDFSDLETSTIGLRFLQHTYNLKRAKEIGDMDINDVLALLRKQGKFEHLIQRITAKATPLLLHNFLGYIDKQPAVNYYIGVNRFENSELYKDDFFENNVEGAGNIQFTNIGMRDRIIIFSQMNPIPPFAINTISSKCKEEYEDLYKTFSSHIDENWVKEMKQKGYGLEPSSSDNALDLWVKGLIFGFIKNEGGSYKYYDKENGDMLWDYWVELDTYRDNAFEKFKECIFKVVDQYNKKINEIVSNNGLPHVRDIYRRAKENYIENTSQVGYTKEYLREHTHELSGTINLLREEMAFVEQLDVN